MHRWTNSLNARIDCFGIAASWLCILHCLALPLLVMVLPAAHCFHHQNDYTHVLLAGWVCLFAVLSVVPGYKRHKSSRILALMILGVGIVLIATFGDCLGMPETCELPLITIGNLFVICAHQLSRRHTSACCRPA